MTTDQRERRLRRPTIASVALVFGALVPTGEIAGQAPLGGTVLEHD